MTCLAIGVTFVELHRNLPQSHSAFFCFGQCYISVVSHGNNSSSEHYWPAGAFGAVRPVGAILPTAFAAGHFSSLLAANGYAAPKAPAGKHVLHFCDFKSGF